MAGCGNSEPDCTSWFEGTKAPTFKADPDIAGLGVRLLISVI